MKTVLTIHDLAFFRMTERLAELERDWVAAIRRRSSAPAAHVAAYRRRSDFFLRLQREVPRSLARADRVVTVSEATASDLVALANVPRHKIRVVPSGLTPGLARVGDAGVVRKTLVALGIDEPYVLYVGALDPNKNIHGLIRAFARTSVAFRRTHLLVIAGASNWFQPVLEEEVVEHQLKDRVRFTGYVPEAALSAAYSGAAVAVSPCPFEGFGFPVIEAMACGTPVVIVDAGALPEVAGDAALRVPPSDIDALAAAIERVACDRVLATELVERGHRRAGAYSWKRTAQMTLDVYTEVAA